MFYGLEAKIDSWLAEDMPYIDITTDMLGIEKCKASARVIAKEKGIVAGLKVFESVFRRVNSEVKVECFVEDGASVKPGMLLAKVEGPASDLLKAERLALNLLQRMSGVASLSGLFAECVKPYGTKIVDTRKTTPGLRQLEKYAVTVGGGYNHRYSLSDAVMVKDNHIKAAGGIDIAVQTIKNRIGHTIKIEVEATSLQEVAQAVQSGADIVMLDNMSLEEMKQAVEAFGSQVVLEASGGVRLETVKEIAETGVPIISVGALTHSYKALDISMDICL